jgi:hypothetical protein
MDYELWAHMKRLESLWSTWVKGANYTEKSQKDVENPIFTIFLEEIAHLKLEIA